MPKRRATSPAQQTCAQSKSARQAEETGDVKSGTAQTSSSSANDDHGDRTPTRGTDDVSNSDGSNSVPQTKNLEESVRPSTLSALAPEFVPRSASDSGTTTPKTDATPKFVQATLPFTSQLSTKSQSRQTSKGSKSNSPSKATIRPVFKSEPIEVKDSVFQARLFSLESFAQVPKITAHMRRQYPDFQHHMAGWQLLALKPGMTGLEGEDAFEVRQGWDDDGEKRGGKAVVDVIEKTGLCDVVVVVSRRFGGTLLGPARFSHIADCTRAVCTAMYERERAAERASRVADLVAQLCEWDTEVAELRLEIAALTKVETRSGEVGEKEKQPTISVSFKPLDYKNVLNPPDVEKAERLLQARQKTVQSLKAVLEKKGKSGAGETPTPSSSVTGCIELRSTTMSVQQPNPLPILTIAGTDPSGGAGVQADLKTFAAHGCYGTSVVTALVAQNTQGVQAVHAPPPEFVAHQIRCVLDDIPPQAIKTGMLADAPTLQAILQTLSSFYPEGKSMPPLVIDPVMVSTSGHSLLESSANALIKEELVPLATMITPNVPEAELLLGLDQGSITSLDTIVNAAKGISKLGARATLVKGGHCKLSTGDVLAVAKTQQDPDSLYIRWNTGTGPDQPAILRPDGAKILEEQDVVVDVLHLRDSKADGVATTTLFVRPRLETTSTHGTGCTLSAALACAFAQGLNPFDATIQATTYSHQAIATAPSIGKGHGPLNHTHSIIPRIIPQPTPVNPYPFVSALIGSCPGLWKDYVGHPFVTQLAAGTLPAESFVHYLKQDYIYLKHHARAHGLLAAKSSTFSAAGAAATIVLHIVRESQMHVDYCTQWGVTPEELETTPELPATAAYARYIMDVGYQGDDFMLIIAVASCLLGYAEVGKRLLAAGANTEGNPYKRWMEDYGGVEYQEATRRGIDLMEQRAAKDPPSASRFAQLQDVWERCVRLEIGFWDMGLKP
ncbi:TENA/THI-4/PQQC family, partial [Rhizoctonia solani]